VPDLENPQQAVFEGEKYIDNARDALDQDVEDEDDLYIWENQLAAIDEFLADTEDMDPEGQDLDEVRAEARECKEKLEAEIAGFFDQPVEAEDTEANIAALLDVARQLIEEAEEVLEARPDPEELDEHANEIETTVIGIKQWLADSEPYHDETDMMTQARRDMKMITEALEEKLDETVSAWKRKVEEEEDDDEE
jgi:DNA repair ATPase RecN